MKNSEVNDQLMHLFRSAASWQIDSDQPHVVEDEELLACWSSGLLSANERQAVMDHLANCASCRSELAGMLRNGVLEFPDVSQHTDNVGRAFEEHETTIERNVISLGTRKRRTVGWTVVALAAAATVLFVLYLNPSAPNDPNNQIAMARQDLNRGQTLQAFERMAKLLDRNLETEDISEAKMVLENSGYQTARTKLLAGQFDEVRNLERRTRDYVVTSGRLSNLKLQADRKVANEYSLETEGSLLDYGFQPDGSSPSKALSVFDDKTEKLKEQFKKSVSEHPGEIGLRINYGQLLLRTGDNEQARKQFDAAIAIDEDNPKALLGRGLVAYELKNFSNALNDFEMVLALDHDNVDAHVNKALCHEQRSQTVKAAGHWKTASQLTEDPDLRRRIQRHLGEEEEK